jgi:hypothetical protein
MNWYKKAWIKEDTYKNLGAYGMKIIEHEAIGPYDIVLIQAPNYFKKIFGTNDYLYQIAIQQEEYDFSDRQQQEKIPSRNILTKSFLEEAKKLINNWIGRYGRLSVGSENDTKNLRYASILSRLGFNVRSVNETWLKDRIFWIE